MNAEILDRVRSTKIVATLGNVSSSPEMLTSLTAAGVNVFRLNFSHGTREEQGLRIDAIRALEAKPAYRTVFWQICKVQNFKVGEIAKGTIVKADERITFDLDTKKGNANIVGLPHEEIFKAIFPGARVDG